MAYSPNNLSVTFTPPTITHGTSVALDGSVLAVSGDSTNNGNPIDVPADVYFHVTSLPAAGTITVGGTPASDFTLAQAQSGSVVYHNDTNPAVPNDSFTLWARCNEGSTPLPLTPHFATATLSGAAQVGLYFGAMLVGATDANLYSTHFSTTTVSSSGVSSFPVTTTAPNSVLLLCFAAYGGHITTVPPAQTVVSISYAGLSFTRLSQQTQLLHQTTSPFGYRNMTLEVWWALAPSPGSGTFTVTTQPIGTTGGLFAADVTVFTNLANPSAPFDTNASNLQAHTATTLPWTGLSMTPNAPEYRVLPWLYEYVAGNSGDVSPIILPGWMPKGYGVANVVADQVTNEIIWHSAGRGPATVAASITFTGPVPAATLAMDTLSCTATAKQLEVNLISLRWSDDRGHSWGSPVTQSIGEVGEYRTSLQWQRLAYARDRVFELSWSVPMATALQGCWIDVTPAQS